MAEIETIGEQIADLKQAAAGNAPSTGGGGVTLGKRAIIALFIIAGLFFAYVIWRRTQNSAQVNAANQQGIAAIGADQTQNDALAAQNSQIAALQQSVTSGDAALLAQDTTLQHGIVSATSQAGAARTDASVAVDLLKKQAASHTPAPPPHTQTHLTHAMKKK